LESINAAKSTEYPYGNFAIKSVDPGKPEEPIKGVEPRKPAKSGFTFVQTIQIMNDFDATYQKFLLYR